MPGQAWDQWIQELAARMPRLASGDTVILTHGDYYVQLQQAPDGIRVEAASSHSLLSRHTLSTLQEDQLRAMGWQAPDPPLSNNWWVERGWPLSGAQARHLVEMMAGALRDVYGARSIDQVHEKAFNAFAGS